MQEAIVSVEIVAIPPGEAPAEIRAAWVGLILPLALPARVVNFGFGVLTAPRTYIGQLLSLLFGRGQRQEGYLVPASAAVALLEKVNPEAARWWHVNTPHLLISPTQTFLFAAESCREILLHETLQNSWPPPPRENRGLPP